MKNRIDTSDEARIEKNAKHAEMDTDLARIALESFIQSEGGKLYFLTLLKSNCMTMQTTFTGNSQTFFNEGCRAVGNAILKDVAKASPEAYAEIMKDIIK